MLERSLRRMAIRATTVEFLCKDTPSGTLLSPHLAQNKHALLFRDENTSVTMYCHLANTREFCLCKTGRWTAFTFGMKYWIRLYFLMTRKDWVICQLVQTCKRSKKPDSWWVLSEAKYVQLDGNSTHTGIKFIKKVSLKHSCSQAPSLEEWSILQFTKSLCSTSTGLVFFWERDAQGLIQWVRHSQSQAQRKRPRFSRMISSWWEYQVCKAGGLVSFLCP